MILNLNSEISSMNKKKILIISVIILMLIISLASGIFIFLNLSKDEETDTDTLYNLNKQQNELHGSEEIWIETLNSEYKVASGQTSGAFRTGQDADMMLSGVDFNNTGGGLQFNHQKGIATDGTHLIVADTQNNRVLIWNSLPKLNTEPDLVLGQKNFTTNETGTGLDNLSWPVDVATDGTHLMIADTYNDRILIWNNFPTQSGQAADIELKTDNPDTGPFNDQYAITWPWAVWTDGTKMIVTSTSAGHVLIWNQIPTSNDDRADISLQSDDFGTPRTIGCDGTHLVIGDHNAYQTDAGNFFWNEFPITGNEDYDFYINDPATIGENNQMASFGYHMGSSFGPNGEFMMINNNYLAIWDSFPEDENDAPDTIVQKEGEDGFEMQDGDGSEMVYAGGKLYLSLSNSNMVAVYDGIPTSRSQNPDFAIGTDDIHENSLEKIYFMTNPVPATNGESLFVSSDFDRKLYVWKDIPDESGAKPNYIYHNICGWDNTLYEETFVLGGMSNVYIWETLPLEKNLPDKTFQNQIGSVQLNDVKGVALDDKYFYLSDGQDNKLYIWEGIPSENSEPKFTLNIQNVWRLSSDGTYLSVTTIYDQTIQIYKIDDLSSNARLTASIGGHGKMNLPQSAMLSNGYLIVPDTGFNRVHIWSSLESALDGSDADIILGEENLSDVEPEIAKDKAFWPASAAYDGTYLWIGEFKFSGRLLRFSPSE